MTSFLQTSPHQKYPYAPLHMLLSFWESSDCTYVFHFECHGHLTTRSM